MPKEGPPGKPKPQIEIHPSDNFHVLALKNIMNETGMQLHEAVREYKSEGVQSVDDPTSDLDEQIDDAAAQISRELAKKKFS